MDNKSNFATLKYSGTESFIVFLVIFFSIVRTSASYPIIALGTIAIFIYLIVGMRNFNTKGVQAILFLFFTIMLFISIISAIMAMPIESFRDTFIVRLVVFYPFISMIILFYNKNETYDIIERYLFVSISAIYSIAVAEILFDFDMISLMGRAGESAVARHLIEDRLLATSIYINYNDLMFIFSIFNALIIGRSYNSSGRKKYVYYTLSAIIFLYQIYVGSRAAIISSVLLYIMLFYVIISSYAGAKRAFVFFLIMAIPTFIVLVYSILEYIISNDIDSSTIERMRIYVDAVNVIFSSIRGVFFGFGEVADFYQQVYIRCGYVCLADPHNIILEIAFSYGIIILLIYMVTYFSVCSRFISGKINHNGLGLVMAFLIFPVAGLGPSSSLNFYLHWWVLVGAMFVTYTSFCSREGRRGDVNVQVNSSRI